MPAAGLADVVDAADVGVRHLSGVPHFRMEALEESGVLLQLPGEELERHRLAELQVVRAIDLAHAAPPEQTRDAVAVGQDLARG